MEGFEIWLKVGVARD